MQVKPWDFMVKDTPSRDWAEGKGAFIVFAFFCGGIAGGLYLTSLYFNNLWGMFLGWLFALSMGIFDIAHLGNKAIVWRIMMRPNSSWISRGFLLVLLFIGSAAVQMALNYWYPGTGLETVFKVISGIAAFGVVTYSGFVLSYVSGIKFWNSTIMPVLFIISGFAGGSAILLVISCFAGTDQFGPIRLATISFLTAYTAIIGLHLWISTYNSATARNSVKQIVAGSLAGIFWPVVVFVGLVIPSILIAVAQSGSHVTVIINAVCILASNLALRYTILKAGMYGPLLPAR
ncbi:MAG: hypothetical protein A2Z29_07625 [Chloroflexi bacterium RBG_16_56_11]|nr:MAG: hypothetical protein A2Z29_07625 [Chloroflexi bacterium RBG_16_56_11]